MSTQRITSKLGENRLLSDLEEKIMEIEEKDSAVEWQLHLSSSPEKVFEMLATDKGRSRFWAESAVEREGEIDFSFPNKVSWRAKIIQQIPNALFQIKYYGGSITTFTLQPDGKTGTDLTLVDRGVVSRDYAEVLAGWVSVLLALKASVDFSIDLRNHDISRTWDQGYVDNRNFSLALPSVCYNLAWPP